MAAQAHEGQRFRIGDNMRGAIVMVLGSVALVGLAYGAMVLLTSPDGWVSKAALSGATGGQQPQIASFGAEDGQ